MKPSCFVTIGILLVFWIQNTESKEITDSFQLSFENTAPKEYHLIKYNYNQRKVKDLWNYIKNSAIKSWDFVKKVVRNTKQKINIWIENVKNRANAVTKAFEDHLNNLKYKLYDIISDVFGNDDIAKQCLKEGQNGIENAFKGILKHMKVCIANELKNLSHLDGKQSQLTVNDTQFFNELEEKHKMCEEDPENVEDCFFKVREDVFKDTEHSQDVVLNNGLESRNIADNILNKILLCSIESLIEATSLITKEALKITKCILEAKKQKGKDSFSF